MKKYKIINPKDIPLEGTHDLPNSRQTLVTKKDIVSKNIDTFTKGFLAANNLWDWHDHKEHDEICVVIKGNGKFYWEDEVKEYKAEDVIIIPAKGKHKIEAESDSNSFSQVIYYVYE